MKTKLYASLAVSALALGFAGNAAASTIGCSSGTTDDVNWDISGKVDPSFDCLILEPLNDNVNDSEAVVNGAEFFGFKDWEFDGKIEENKVLPENPDFQDYFKNDSSFFTFTVFDDGLDNQDNPIFLSGTFTWIGNPDVAQDYDFMFVFKDGGSTNLVAYRIDMDNLLAQTATNGLAAQTGTYDTPFLFPPFVQQHGNVTQKDISHISVYYRENGFENGQIIPEPATLGLLGIGLFGLGMASYRRRRLASTEV